MRAIIETTIFSRANAPDSISCIYPKGHEKFPEGKQVTELESLRENRFARRKDMALINCFVEKPYKHLWQVAIEPDKQGYPVYGEYEQYFSKAEKEEMLKNREELLKLIKQYPEYKVYLGY